MCRAQARPIYCCYLRSNHRVLIFYWFVICIDSVICSIGVRALFKCRAWTPHLRRWELCADEKQTDVSRKQVRKPGSCSAKSAQSDHIDAKNLKITTRETARFLLVRTFCYIIARLLRVCGPSSIFFLKKAGA